MLQWTRRCRYILSLCFHLLWVNTQYRMVGLFLISWVNSMLFTIVPITVYVLTSHAQVFPFHHIFATFVISWHFDNNHSNSGRWCPIVILICMSLIKDVNNLFIDLLAIYVSSSEKCLFRSFANFKCYFIIRCYWIVWVYIFWILAPCELYGTQISSSIL